ncbi:hypothetical protein BaRGS_00014628 [Batillaria attramentaria]|uniref:Uncharacterized protein n=1 Tax=Batillaria attramentaria TaxID=370345 RepID=A0ABD0JTI0_9CAEN
MSKVGPRAVTLPTSRVVSRQSRPEARPCPCRVDAAGDTLKCIVYYFATCPVQSVYVFKSEREEREAARFSSDLPVQTEWGPTGPLKPSSEGLFKMYSSCRKMDEEQDTKMGMAIMKIYETVSHMMTCECPQGVVMMME